MIAIVDYGMGNLRSVQKGFAKVGHEAEIVADAAALERADKIVLPGVGAFADAMDELHRRGLVEPLRKLVGDGRPFLGICLGLQLLFETGFEDGRHEGLGIFAGEVVRFDLPHEFKVPHMGWNQLEIRRPAPVLAGLPPDTYVYFVHSYYVVPKDPAIVATETTYGRPFCSMIWQKNVFATQFHPEKSQADGLKILANFAAL
ncbi:MAG: imidazole glycerol phosphate synthase subunit HisH [Pirellulales bacterium]|nr:imidazole glycerol phosphate synthase subunit HisH [Pirellulales bacterium]